MLRSGHFTAVAGHPGSARIPARQRWGASHRERAQHPGNHGSEQLVSLHQIYLAFEECAGEMPSQTLFNLSIGTMAITNIPRSSHH